MTTQLFPELHPEEFSATRDALHVYSGILGGWASTCRAPRKHWWHASLRPSLGGVTTEIVYAGIVSFEIELSFLQSKLFISTHSGETRVIALHGQAAMEPANQIHDFLKAAGIPEEIAAAANAGKAKDRTKKFGEYSLDQANRLGQALAGVNAALVSFRAGIREETSPIQLWPHHFDLAMLWLPGDKVPDQDPEKEEYADKQMNFGFTFGDTGIAEPYFYITAYPLFDALAKLKLPDGTSWQSERFTGAVLTYRRLRAEANPAAYLLKLWNQLLDAGKKDIIGPPS